MCLTTVCASRDNNDAPPPGPSYRWRVDAWGQCSTTCGNGEQKGVLHCYDDTSAEDVEISRCQDPPPSSSRTCKIVPCPLVSLYLLDVYTFLSCSGHKHVFEWHEMLHRV